MSTLVIARPLFHKNARSYITSLAQDPSSRHLKKGLYRKTANTSIALEYVLYEKLLRCNKRYLSRIDTSHTTSCDAILDHVLFDLEQYARTHCGGCVTAIDTRCKHNTALPDSRQAQNSTLPPTSACSFVTIVVCFSFCQSPLVCLVRASLRKVDDPDADVTMTLCVLVFVAWVSVSWCVWRERC